MKKLLLILFALLTSVANINAQVTMNIDPNNSGAKISDYQYGLFFEEINHAGDGGLYAELIRNRSFEDNSTSADQWSTIGSASLGITSTDLINDAQSQAAQVLFTKSGDGIANSGFWGINIVKGNTYKLSFWVRS